jgi:hypothetical protein
MLHPFFLVETNSTPFIVLKACGFCKVGYNYYDISITSYNHTYHPFCLGEMLKIGNKCLVCGELLHFKWWTSFGFCERDEKMQSLTSKICLNELQEELKNTLKEEAGLVTLKHGENS